MNCDGTVHNLREIYSSQEPYVEHVVRWCRDCGAVVVDVDCDGRTQPGGYQTMLFPNMSYPNQRIKP